MITINSASNSAAPTSPKIGLAMAGGGPLGAIYAFGALRALEESLEEVQANALDTYVGVSSGAFLAANLANGYGTEQLYRIFIESNSARHRFRPTMFYQPASREYLRRVAAIPKLFLNTASSALRSPLKFKLSDQIGRLTQLVPAGMFDNEALNEFLTALFSAPGKTNDFRKLDCQLAIVAVDLDTGQAVRFGTIGRRHIPISKAVQASAALPGLYPPVEIENRYFVDGALRRTLHASVALDAGADIVFAINPLVPFDAEKARRKTGRRTKKLSSGGLPAVLSQTFRSLIQSRMQIGIEKYESLYENADLVLLEPNRDDAKMFFTNVLSYVGRKKLADHAYRTTRTELLRNADKLQETLNRHGIKLNRDILSDRQRTLEQSFSGLTQFNHPVTARLGSTLRDLRAAFE